jgi:glycosyltransferase involved in cell wall biosynthesis
MQADAGLEPVVAGYRLDPSRRPIANPRVRVEVLDHLLKQVTSDAFSVVHIHGLWDRGLPAAARWAKKNGLPVVLSPHGMLTGWALQQAWLKKKLYRAVLLNRVMPRGTGALTLHYCTEWEREHSKGYWNNPRNESSVVLPLSLDVQRVRRDAQENRLGVSSFVGAVFLGRVYPGKGLEYLIPAMVHVPVELGQLTVIGDWDNPFGHGLRRQAEQLGIADRIDWRGAVYPPELYGMLASASVLVLPSDHENFGLVAVEAVACGTPALVSREVAVGGMLVDAGAAAWIDREPTTLGHELARWLRPERRDKLKDMQSRCASSAMAFDHSAVGRRWMETYQQVVARLHG